MRKAIDLQMELWKTDIANIEFDLQSRKDSQEMPYAHPIFSCRVCRRITKFLNYSLTNQPLTAI